MSQALNQTDNFVNCIILNNHREGPNRRYEEKNSVIMIAATNGTGID
jgi:hypothetical protein